MATRTTPAYIVGTVDDEVTVAVQFTQSNDDWIRAARLQDEDSIASRRKLQKMENTPMVRVTTIPDEEE